MNGKVCRAVISIFLLVLNVLVMLGVVNDVHRYSSVLLLFWLVVLLIIEMSLYELKSIYTEEIERIDAEIDKDKFNHANEVMSDLYFDGLIEFTDKYFEVVGMTREQFESAITLEDNTNE